MDTKWILTTRSSWAIRNPERYRIRSNRYNMTSDSLSRWVISGSTTSHFYATQKQVTRITAVKSSILEGQITWLNGLDFLKGNVPNGDSMIWTWRNVNLLTSNSLKQTHHTTSKSSWGKAPIEYTDYHGELIVVPVVFSDLRRTTSCDMITHYRTPI